MAFWHRGGASLNVAWHCRYPAISWSRKVPTFRVRPFPLAMVICDAVWRDPATGKWTLLGCFSAIEARVFPCFRPNLAVFVSLTDGRGKTPLKLRLVDVNEEQETDRGGGNAG